MRWQTGEGVEPRAEKGLRGSLTFWVEVGGGVCGDAHLPTLQQEAESVLAPQDDWGTGGQASHAGQVSQVS